MPDEAFASDLTSHRFRALGVAALLALLALVASLDRWIAIDDAVWRGVLLSRGCATDAAVDRGVELATRGLAFLLVVVAAMRVRASGLRSVWPWLGTWVLGLLTSKMLKHLLTRERPSSLPDIAIGYSFPSAHTMNGLVAMLAVIALARGFRHRGLWSGVAAGLAATVAGGRIALGHHWLSDVLGGGLSALVLAGFAVPAIARRPMAVPLLLATVGVAGLALDHSLGAAGIHLPSPLLAARSAVVDLDVGPELRSTLRGSWQGNPPEPPFGSYLWLEGSGVVPFTLSDTTADAGGSWQVAFAGRPDKRAPCVTLDVALNGEAVARFVPFVGWREYRLPIASGLVRPGRNELTFVAEAADGGGRFGVTYVRFRRRSAAE